MKRMMIIGSGGSGKSTLARQLGEILHIQVYQLDAIFWKPNWEGVSREEQRSIQTDLVKNEEWIIDGNYGRTMDIRLNAADAIIFLDINRTICTYRALKRMMKYRNKTRPDMGEGCEEKFDFDFLKWICNYPKMKRPDILRKLNHLSENKQIIILKSSKDVQSFLGNLKAISS